MNYLVEHILLYKDLIDYFRRNKEPSDNIIPHLKDIVQYLRIIFLLETHDDFNVQQAKQLYIDLAEKTRDSCINSERLMERIINLAEI